MEDNFQDDGFYESFDTRIRDGFMMLEGEADEFDPYNGYSAHNFVVL